MNHRQHLGRPESIQGRGLAMTGILLLAVLSVTPTARAAAQAEDGVDGDFEFVERVVATVDSDPIMASEIARIVDLGLVPAGEEEDEWSRRRRVLDLLIAERLQFHQLEFLGLDDASADDAAAHLALFHRRYPSYRPVLLRIERDGIDDPAVRQMLAHQAMTLSYIEERLGPRVFISDEEIEAYYRETYRSRSSPPLEEVRETARAALTEQRLVVETEAWTAELRDEAEIIDEFGVRESVAAADR